MSTGRTFRSQNQREGNVPFYLLQKIPCPTKCGRCNEEETVREKERKERKESKAKKGRETKRPRQKNKRKQMARSGQTDMRDIYPCAAVVVDYLFVSKWLGLGYCLVQ
jgi:hypothetical protein